MEKIIIIILIVIGPIIFIYTYTLIDSFIKFITKTIDPIKRRNNSAKRLKNLKRQYKRINIVNIQGFLEEKRMQITNEIYRLENIKKYKLNTELNELEVYIYQQKPINTNYDKL